MTDSERLYIIVDQIKQWSDKYGYTLSDDMQKLINEHSKNELNIEVIYAKYKNKIDEINQLLDGRSEYVKIPYYLDKVVKVQDKRACIKCGHSIDKGDKVATGYRSYGKIQRIWMCPKCLNKYIETIDGVLDTIKDDDIYLDDSDF